VPPSAGEAVAPKDEAAEGLEIAGRLAAPRRSDYRSIVDEIERFAEALRSAGYRSGKIKLPFDVTPEGVLTGDMRTGNVESGDTRFSLLLSRVNP
jgi:hypothetical protein